ncbi:hypothetical protein [Roseibium denhamense]|uniref:hypothetical protein n=1 Tax=Roseibium denhamense TaxID=76305 RepID=UPI0024B7E891|nr:hypothetical protein [Roseibium denhamense]
MGTTSIQAYANRNKDRILQQNSCIWIPNGNRSGISVTTVIEKNNASDCDVLMCDEGLWHFADTKKVDLDGIRAALGSRYCQAVLYIREPVGFLQSWYLQGLKSGTGQPSFAKFLASPFVRRSLDFEERLPIFRKLFDEVTIRCFDKNTLVNHDAVADFMAFAGLDVTGNKPVGEKNVTTGPNRLMREHLRSKYGVSDKEIYTNCGAYVDWDDTCDIVYHEEVQEILSTYEASYRYLEQYYGLNFEDFYQTSKRRDNSQSIRECFDLYIRGANTWNEDQKSRDPSP